MNKSSKPPARSGKPMYRKQANVNPRLGAQTRKVLHKHYRAKHGVR